jgi:hypothetical protein
LAKQWTGGPGGPTQKAMANTAGVGSTGAGGVFNRASAAMGAVGGGIKHAAGAVGGKIGSVMNAPVPGTKTGTVKGMMAAAALGNIPGMAGYALYARHRGRGKGAQTSSQPTPEVGSLRMSPSGNAPAAQTSSAMPTAPAQTAMRSRLP